MQWHVNEPADAATHALEHYAVIEAVEGATIATAGATYAALIQKLDAQLR